jgi:hypothetical protein
LACDIPLEAKLYNFKALGHLIKFQKVKAGLSLHKAHQAPQIYSRDHNQFNYGGVTEVASVCQLGSELIDNSNSQTNGNTIISFLEAEQTQ